MNSSSIEPFDIIVADDHNLFRKGVMRIVEDFPFIRKVYPASNGREVLGILKTATPLPSLVLLDLMMPEMDGMEATKHIKKEFPEVKIIILSMIQQQDSIKQMLEQDVNGYLLKDCSEDELIRAIKTVMEHSYYYTHEQVLLMQRSTKGGDGNESQNNRLSKREEDVLKLLCQALSPTEIADELFISVRTVEVHKRNIMEKTGCRNTVEMVLYGIKIGLAEVDINSH